MRGYWVRIVLGAIAIFVMGYAGISVVRSSVGRVHELADSSEPINIPLALVPFTLDGSRAGTFRGLTILRSSPKAISAFRARVALGDSADPTSIQACQLAMVGGGRDFDPGRGFRCVTLAEGDSALVRFGEIVFVAGDGTEFEVPFLLDSAAARELQSGGQSAAEAARAAAESEAAAARAEADRIRVEVRTRVDSALERAGVKAPTAPRRP